MKTMEQEDLSGLVQAALAVRQAAEALRAAQAEWRAAVAAWEARPLYPQGDVVGPCVCGSWPGGKCLRCKATVDADGYCARCHVDAYP